MAEEMFLMVSCGMDSNKKRNEHELIRLPSTARKSSGLENLLAEAEIMKDNSELALASVKVFHAFSDDLKNLRKRGFTEADINNTAFVSSKTFSKVIGNAVLDDGMGDRIQIKLAKASKDPLTGADPEFLLFDDSKRVVPAHKVLAKNGPIGSDGAMIEIRPTPSKTVDGLISNMKSIFRDKNLTNGIRELDWVASVYHADDTRDYPVGGHIHVGNTDNIAVFNTSERCYLFAVMNKIVDELLSIPMIKLDGKVLGKSRRSDCKMAMGDRGYGYYGSWRICSGRLEHRTLSGMWLAHPDIAHAVIGCAKAITGEVFSILSEMNYSESSFKHKHIDFSYISNDHLGKNDFYSYKELYNIDFDGWKDIKLAKTIGCTKSSKFMASILNDSRIGTITKGYINSWYEHMKNLSTYKKYSDSIDYLYNMLMLPQSKLTAISTDIKKNWTSDDSLKF